MGSTFISMKMAYKSRELSKNKQYYDADSGALVTDRYINHLGGVYYVDKNGEPLKGAQTIQGKQVYFNDYNGLQVRDGFASNEHFYDKDGNLVTDSYVFSTKYNYNNTIYPFYVDKNGDKLKGEQNHQWKICLFR